MTGSFWNGRRVLVTGHTGFKGGWLSLWLQEAGAAVTGYALAPPTDPSLFELADVESAMVSVTGDVRDFDRLVAAVGEAKPEVVFHLAAQPLVRYSYAHPRETYETNVIGTVNLLEAVRQVTGVRAVVVVTSDKCYENREWVWPYRESEALGGHDPYSSSKGCAEIVTAAYRSSYFSRPDGAADATAIASARAGNVIGGGDWSNDRLIPDFIRGIASGQPISVRNPNAVRPWQHVLEPLSGYMTLAQRLFEGGARYAQAWNFGPSEDEARPVSWLVERLVNSWGEGASWKLGDGTHPHEATWLKLDSSMARTHLGWHPELSLEQGLGMVVDWYKAHARGEDMRNVTLDQIRTYRSQT